MDSMKTQTISVETRQASKIKNLFKEHVEGCIVYVKTLQNTKKMVDLIIKYPERLEETVKTLIRQTLTGDFPSES